MPESGTTIVALRLARHSQALYVVHTDKSLGLSERRSQNENVPNFSFLQLAAPVPSAGTIST